MSNRPPHCTMNQVEPGVPPGWLVVVQALAPTSAREDDVCGRIAEIEPTRRGRLVPPAISSLMEP